MSQNPIIRCRLLHNPIIGQKLISHNLIIVQKRVSQSRDNPTLHQQAYKPILDTTNIPNTENPVMARVKVTKPNKENPIMDQEPKSENPPSENPTVGKPNCINNTDALNNTNFSKGSEREILIQKINSMTMPSFQNHLQGMT